MAENQTQPTRVVNSREIVKTKFTAELAKFNFGIQALSDKASKLVFNEDHVEEIKKFIEDLKKASKVLEEAHKKEKAPALKECQDIDKAKNDVLDQLNSLLTTNNKKYQDLAKKIADDAKKIQDEKDRKEKIKTGITNNVLAFSRQIAECVTLEQLTEVQNRVNLERANKKKYEEFLDLANESYSKLNEQVNKQKETIRELDKLKAAAKKKLTDYEKLELEEKIEEVKNRVEENKVSVQEEAINSSTSVTETYEVIHTGVKAKRTTWEYEIKDIKELFKKMPHLVDLIANDEKITELIKTKKAAGEFAGKEELMFFGIRFYEKKIY
jgi:chromosome segregation ATPase